MYVKALKVFDPQGNRSVAVAVEPETEETAERATGEQAYERETSRGRHQGWRGSCLLLALDVVRLGFGQLGGWEGAGERKHVERVDGGREEACAAEARYVLCNRTHSRNK